MRKNALVIVFSFLAALVGIPASTALAAEPVFRAAASSNANTVSPAVTLPASVQDGDQLVLIVSINTNATIDTPAGWLLLGTEEDSTMKSSVFTRTADASTPGTTVVTPLSALSKTAMTLTAYSGATPAVAATSSVISGTSADLTTPAADVGVGDSVVISYWANKTSSNTGWALPGNVTERATSIGTGGGRIVAATGDTVAPAGTWPGATATSTIAAGKGIAWTIVIPPADTGGNQDPVADFSAVCNDLDCTFDATDSFDTGGSISSYDWDFGDGTTADDAGDTVDHTYDAAGLYDVTLTVTDNEGASSSLTQSLDVSVTVGGPSTLEFRAAASSNANTVSPAVTLPASVQDGDQLVLIVSINTNATIDTPAGWLLLGTEEDSTMKSSVFTRTADASTPGTTVVTPLSALSKTAMTLTAYSGATPAVAATSSVISGTSADLTTPAADVGVGDSVVISYWANKTSSNTGWALPGNVTERATSIGTGGGRIVAATGDTVAPAGTWPGATATSTIAAGKGIAWTIVIPPADTNADPTAAFTSTCTLLSCAFDSSTSDDTDGSIISYAWDFGDGASSADANPTHVYADGDDYDVTLTVTDNGGATDSVTDTASPNATPVASFTYLCDDLECTFDASGSTDDGSIVSYAWDFGDAGNPTPGSGVNPSHTFSGEDTFTVELTVTDDETTTDSASQSVTTVILPNADPTADFTYDCDNLECTFDAVDSSDTDGSIVSYAWDFGDAGNPTPGSGVNPSHTFSGEDTFTVELTVTDNESGEGTTTRDVTVAIATNAAPTADFTYDCNNLVCTFTDTSDDSDGSIASHSWNFGDGSTSTLANPGHTYAGNDTVTVSLTVVDDDGDEDTTSQELTVAANVAPVAAITPDCDGLVCTFDALDSSDTDGSIVSYEWSFEGGGTATGVTAAKNYSFPGTYDVSLTVTDDDGATDVASNTLTVDLPAVANIAFPPDTPRTDMPRINNGEITDLEYIGTRVYVVGTFTSVQNSPANGGNTINQPFVTAFDMNTGLVDTTFRPTFGGGGVTEIAASPDGTKLFVVGRFNTVNGITRRKIASINPVTGATVTSFTANADAAATAVAATNTTVYVGGQFVMVNGTPKVGLVAVNANTGDLIGDFQNDLAGGIGVNGALTVQALDLSSDLSRLLVVHTGRQIAGQDRYGMGLIDTTTNDLLTWRSRLWDDNLVFVGGVTRIYAGAISPDGSYFVVSSGSGGDRPPISDTVVAYPITGFENNSDVQPLWISRMFDSVYSLAVSDDAVFAGGHMNYMESPTAPDPWPGLDNVGYGRGQGLAGYGLGDDIVTREHIGAIDPVEGKALEWNPGSNSFEGNKAMLVTPRGVITGGDATTQGGANVGRIAFYDTNSIPAAGANETSIVFPIEGRVEEADVEFLVGGEATASSGVQRVQLEVIDMDSRQYLQDDLTTWSNTWNVIFVDLASPGATSTVWSQPLTVSGNRRIQLLARTFGLNGSRDLSKASKKIETFGLSDETPNTRITGPFGIQPTLTFTVTGTADDDLGVTAILIAVRDSQDRYIQDDGSVGPNYNTVRIDPDVVGATNATWSYELTVPYESEWTMQAIAVDTSGQSDLRSSDRSWVVNESALAPSVAIVTPAIVNPPTATAPLTMAPGSPITFSGSATDDEGLRLVEIRLRNSTTGENLAADGTWGVDAIRGWHTISPVNIAGSTYDWTYTTPFNLVPGQYDFEVRAEDDLELTTSSSLRGRLTINVQIPGDDPPDARIDVGGTITDVQVLHLDLTGTATDDFGVASVRVSLRDNDTGRYLQPDGTMAAANARLDAVLGTPNGTSTTWSLSVDLPTQGDFSVTAYGYDTVGQQDTSTSGATARYKIYPGDLPPTITENLLQPSEGDALTEARIFVSGRAEDDQQIFRVQVAVRDSSNRYMSSSGTFGSTNPSWITAFLNSPGSPGSNFSYTTPPIPDGAYTVFVRAVDQHDFVTPVPSERNVTVSGPVDNLPPVADFGYSCVENVCTFDARSSTDENAPTLTYSWNFGNGGGSGPLPVRTYTSAGVYTVTVTAIDEYGLSHTSDPQEVTIGIPAGNVAPIPVLNPPSCALLACNFSSVGSEDPNVGDSFTRLWDFGDGTTSTSTSPSHTYAAPGPYTVTLTVTDGWGVASAPATFALTVSDV